MSSETTEKGGEVRRRFTTRVAFSLIVLFSVLFMLAAVSVGDLFAQSPESAQAVISPERAEVLKWGLIAAAAAFGVVRRAVADTG